MLKLKKIVLVFFCSLLLVGASTNAGTLKEKKFVFPDDVTMVYSPTLPVGYTEWDHRIDKCRLSDRRMLVGKLYYRTIGEGEVALREKLFFYSLDGKDFIRLHYAVSADWHEIFGTLFMTANGGWGAFNFNGHMGHLRATKFFVPTIKKHHNIKEGDLESCIK